MYWIQSDAIKKSASSVEEATTTEKKPSLVTKICVNIHY